VPGQPDDRSASFADEAWDARERNETPLERLDRNWTDLLQELRVLQTGVQFLTGFLLTLPLQVRFTTLSTAQDVVYLATVASAVLATGLFVAPVSVHRALFRQHARRATVEAANTLLRCGLVLLGLAIVGVVTLIFSVVSGTAAASVAAVAAAAMVLLLWLALPRRLNRQRRPDRQRRLDKQRGGEEAETGEPN
jgi:hypothetical protein